jgi:hypothetical protein
MFHGRDELGQRILSGVDLAIDLATLGEYGLEPFTADGYRRQRADLRSRPGRRPGWEAPATTPRGACGTAPHRTPLRPLGGAPEHPRERVRLERGAPDSGSTPVDFRAAIGRYSA